MKQLEGTGIDIDEDRSVFLSFTDNLYWLRFRNGKENTNIKLSKEAMLALMACYTIEKRKET